MLLWCLFPENSSWEWVMWQLLLWKLWNFYCEEREKHIQDLWHCIRLYVFCAILLIFCTEKRSEEKRWLFNKMLFHKENIMKFRQMFYKREYKFKNWKESKTNLNHIAYCAPWVVRLAQIGLNEHNLQIRHIITIVIQLKYEYMNMLWPIARKVTPLWPNQNAIIAVKFITLSALYLAVCLCVYPFM